MRPMVVAFLTALCSSPVSAEIYKCKTDSGEIKFQQIPCEGAILKRPTSESGATVQGFNAECTHYNGRKLLGLSQMGKLSEAAAEEYLEWLFSDEAPTSEEKEDCLNKQDVPTQRARADRKSQVEEAYDEVEAIDAYGFAIIVKHQADYCEGLGSDDAETALDLLEDYKDDTEDLRRQGQQLANTGIEVFGEEISAEEIQKGITDKVAEIDAKYGSTTEVSETELLEECAQLPTLIEFKYNMLSD